MKLAAVPYLNALPLIHYLAEKPRLAPPAALDRLLKLGEVDLATAPIATLLENPHYGLVPGVAIGTKGRVESVRLIIKKAGMKLSDVQSIYLDMESRTSVMLLKVLLKFKYKIDLGRIQFVTPIPHPGVDAALLIGDKALGYPESERVLAGSDLLGPVKRSERSLSWSTRWGSSGGEQDLPLNHYDLGHEWCEWTGLPFVFAAWISPKPVIDSQWISVLQEARDQGLKNLDAIVESLPNHDFIRNYLQQNISYDLGETEIEGIKRFHGYARELGLVKGDLTLRFY